jgi:hypothetical protein
MADPESELSFFFNLAFGVREITVATRFAATPP